MMNVIPHENAIRATIKFAGSYGLSRVTMHSTMAQRCLSRADLTLHSDNPDVFDVELKNVCFPNLVVRGVAQMMMINFKLHHINVDEVLQQ